MQALAINVLLEQPNGAALLDEVYRDAKLPGRLLVLCGLRSADPSRFGALATSLEISDEAVPVYDDCIGWEKTAAKIVSEISSTQVCTDIARSKERIRGEFKPAR